MPVCKVMTHEVGHMFGLKHCVFYECAMNGSNSGEESARRPFWLCPVCLRKLQHVINFDVLERYEALKSVCAELGENFGKIGTWYEKAYSIIYERINNRETKRLK